MAAAATALAAAPGARAADIAPPAERAAQHRAQQAEAVVAQAQQADRVEKAADAAREAAEAARKAAQDAARSAEAARKAAESVAAFAARLEAAAKRIEAAVPRVVAASRPPPRGASPAGHRPTQAERAAEQAHGRRPAAPRPGPAATTGAAPAGGPIVVCVEGDTDPSCTYRDLSKAFRAARDGATVVIRPGTYFQAGILKANNVTIRGKGAHLKGVAAQGKAALVLAGSNTTVIGLECSGISVRDRNGACIRLEKPGLKLRDVYFHDNQEGILTGSKGGDILIENSRFERNGANRGRAHQIYVGDADSLTIRHSRIISAVGEGHEVKSRARKTVIEDSVIAALDTQDSRAIDVPNGGTLIVRNCTIERGPKTDNSDIVGFGFEIKSTVPGQEKRNTITMTGNTFIIDSSRPDVFVRGRDIGAVTIKDNVVIGPMAERPAGNKYFRSRAEAGFPPYPALSRSK